jgi:hypothetical protein
MRIEERLRNRDFLWQRLPIQQADALAALVEDRRKRGHDDNCNSLTQLVWAGPNAASAYECDCSFQIIVRLDGLSGSGGAG